MRRSGQGSGVDVAVPEVSVRPQVAEARKKYEKALHKQRVGD